MPSYNELFNPMDLDLTEELVDTIVKKGIRYNQYKEIAVNRAEEEFYIQMERLKIKLGKNTNIPDSDYKEMEQLLQQFKELKTNDDLRYAAFITVSPSASTLMDFDHLDTTVKKCLSKHWVDEYVYCYEQRSADKDNIHGLHVHILLRRHTKPSHLEREVRNTFKHIVGTPKHINIQYKKKEWIKDKIEYMRGNKTDSGKPEKVVIDKLMRKTLGIGDLFYSPSAISWGEKGKN